MSEITLKQVYERLTPRRKEIYDFIRTYSLINNGNVPSLRDIAHHIGTWVSSVAYHVNLLKSFGLLGESDNPSGYCLVGVRFSVDFTEPIEPSSGQERGHDIFNLFNENGEDKHGHGDRQRDPGRAVRTANDIEWFKSNYQGKVRKPWPEPLEFE